VCNHAPSAPSAAAAPRPASNVTFTHLGVAGWRISDGTHVVLVDPYYSRPALDGPADAPLQPDAAAIAARAPAHADLILVGHSHFDSRGSPPPPTELSSRPGYQRPADA
jgi:hypothetical protein